jgi:hypothetical protein
VSHGFAGHVAEFLDTDEDALIGRLIEGVASTGVNAHRNAQIEAWRAQIRILRYQLANVPFRDWFIVLEYELPRRARRPDVVLLYGGIVFAVEFKVGAEGHDAGARWQVYSYALDLRDFHAESHDRTIIPVLCATRASSRAEESYSGFDPVGVTEVVLATSEDLGQTLLTIAQKAPSATPIDPWRWIASPYRPTPTIIEAAVRLYEGHGVRELSHRYAHNLDRTTAMLVRVIAAARRPPGSHYRKCTTVGIDRASRVISWQAC